MLEKGKRVGEYILLEKLGAGGFGEVWKAEKRTELSTSFFAVKFFRPKDDDVIDLEIVKKEIQTWQSLSGLPNVISVIEANKFEDYVFIVSEFAEGGSLDKWLKTNGGKARSTEEAVKIAGQILRGLEGMHGEGFVHRDLKPANVLLKRNIFYLADFGISRQIKTHSKTNSTAGTYEFMPPEAFEKNPSVSVHTDIWAVGAILQKLLTGQLPFPQDEIPSLITAILMSEPEPLPENFPRSLREIVKKSLQKNRADRFQSAKEMREALRNVLTPPKSVELRTFSQAATIEDSGKTEKYKIAPTRNWQEIQEENRRQREAEQARLEKERIHTELEEYRRKQKEVGDAFQQQQKSPPRREPEQDQSEKERIEHEAEEYRKRKEQDSFAERDQEEQRRRELVAQNSQKNDDEWGLAWWSGWFYNKIKKRRNNGKSKIKRRLLITGLTLVISSIIFWAFLLNQLFIESLNSDFTNIASLLLILGADINAVGRNEMYSESTALHQAVQNTNIKNVSWLLSKGANVNSRMEGGYTPLILASFTCSVIGSTRGNTRFEILKILTDKGADINAKNDSGSSALFGASYCGDFEVFKFLLERGAGINVKDVSSNTVLLSLSKSASDRWCLKDEKNVCQDGDSMKILRLLLDKGVDVNAANYEGETALMYVSSVYTGAVDLLIKKGANVNARNKKGKTVLGLTRERLNAASEENKKFYNQVIQILQSAGAVE